MPTNVTTKTIYSNHVIQAPDGTPLCRVGEERTAWYLARGLATVVQEDPFTIRLNFEPKGRGHAHDSYYLADKDNRCVVCGREDTINRHHVIPRVFRKHLPSQYKDRNSHDVVILCVECHSAYETIANRMKQEIGQKLGFLPSTSIAEMSPEEMVERGARYAASVLNGQREHALPQTRKSELEIKVRQFVGDVPLSEELLASLARNVKASTRSLKGEDLGQFVVARVDIDEFCLTWRRHFVETMRPKFLPQGWSIDNPLFSTN